MEENHGKKTDIYSENISVVRFNYIFNWKGKETHNSVKMYR